MRIVEDSEEDYLVTIFHGDNLKLIRTIKDGTIDLIYIDPPFNTGRIQSRTQIETTRDEQGDRVGFQGKRYRTDKIGRKFFVDRFDDYMGFLEPRLVEARRVLADHGSLFLHLDCREVHYAKVLLDTLFGRPSFMNEIIWAYDYGARSKIKWPMKHDNILWYAKDPKCYRWNYDQIDRIPYLAPGLVGKEKAERGKTPTDTWWNTIVSPTGKEKTGYPTQKPLAILNRIVKVHSNPGDLLFDFFAGSGSFGEAAASNGRNVILADSSIDAVDTMYRRLKRFNPVELLISEEV